MICARIGEAPGDPSGSVELWSGYPLQFGGQRRFGWQDEMAAGMRAALAGLATSPGGVLSGAYLSTDKSRCDVQNRLFTNPGSSVFPKAVRSIRFERGLGLPPEPPAPVARVDGHLYYYRYCPGGTWQWWEPGETLARWRRVTRRVGADGSGRPVWLAMKLAAAAGQVEVPGPAPDDTMPFGVRLIVHSTPGGPRQAVAISESLIDGTIAAFHAGVSGDDAAAAAAALAPRQPGISQSELADCWPVGAHGRLIATNAGSKAWSSHASSTSQTLLCISWPTSAHPTPSEMTGPSRQAVMAS